MRHRIFYVRFAPLRGAYGVRKGLFFSLPGTCLQLASSFQDPAELLSAVLRDCIHEILFILHSPLSFIFSFSSRARNRAALRRGVVKMYYFSLDSREDVR